jgi:hypothetical protein
MDENFWQRLFDQFSESAQERFAQKAAEKVVDGFFNGISNSGSHTSNQTGQSYPNLVADGNGWQPASGYRWVDPNAKNDFRVVWSPGLNHLKHPNVIAAQKEGNWNPSPGYKWTNPNAQNDFRVSKDDQPRGTFEKIWVDFDITEARKLGMKIHLKFQVDNLKGAECHVTSFFYFEDGKHLADKNGNYRSTSGEVCVTSAFTPSRTSCAYNDLALFIPYSELHLSKGVHSLAFRIRLFNQAKQKDIAWSDNYCFVYILDDKEYIFGEEEVIDTMSILQVLIANQLGTDVLNIDPELGFFELFGTRFLDFKQFIRIVERNFNIKVNYSDPEEIEWLKELDTLPDVTMYIVFKRKALPFGAV